MNIIAISPRQQARIPSLFVAVETRDKAGVEKILKRDKSLIKKKNGEQQTLLHVAVSTGDEEITKFLISKGGTALINMPDTRGLTPLHIAAQKQTFSLCTILINSSADLNAVNNKGETVLHILGSLPEPKPAPFYNLLQLVIGKGAESGAVDYQGNNAAHIAAQFGSEQMILGLKGSLYLFDEKNKDNVTPLQLAARTDKIDMVQLLLNLGASKSAFQRDCDRGLFSVRITEKFKTSGVVIREKLLVKDKSTYLRLAGDVKGKRKSKKWSSSSRNSTTKKGMQLMLSDKLIQGIVLKQDVKSILKKENRVPLSLPGTEGRFPLNVAAEHGRFDIVKVLVQKLKINANSLDPKTGLTPLLLAAKYDNIAIVEFLLFYADTQVLILSKNNNKSVLHYMVAHPITNPDIMLPLFKRIIDQGLDINSKTKKQGYTAVHIAVIHGNLAAINLLHFIRVDLQLPCLNGMSPIQMAAYADQGEIVRLLLEFGVPKSLLQDAITQGDYSPTIISIVNTVKRVDPTSKRKSIRLSITHASASTPPNPTPDPDVLITPRSKYSTSFVTTDMFTTQNHPIHSLIARKTNKVELTRYIRKEGVEVLSIPNPMGQTALHIATQLQFPDIVSLLVEKYRVPLDRKDDSGETPLLIAAGNFDIKLCIFLIQNGANVSVQNGEGNFLHILCASDSSQEKAFTGTTLLHEVVECAVMQGLDIDGCNGMGNAALHVAAYQGNTSLLTVLLSHSASIDLLSTFEQITALQIAIVQCHKGAVRLLRSKGASTELLDAMADSITPEIREVLYIVECMHPPKSEDTKQFHRAICMGNKVDIKHLIRNDPLLIHSTDENGNTALSVATSLRNKELVEELLERSADVNRIDKRGLSPLFLAARSGSLSLVSTFLQYGANPHTILPHTGSGILHALANTSTSSLVSLPSLPAIIESLLQAGIPIQSKNNHGDTPLHVAAKHNNTALLTILLSHSANPNIYNRLGETPLLLALEQECLVSATELLEKYNATKDFFFTNEINRNKENMSSSLIDFLYRNKMYVPNKKGYAMKTEQLAHLWRLVDTSYRSKLHKMHVNSQISNLIPSEGDIEEKMSLTEVGAPLRRNEQTKEWETLYKQCCVWRGLPPGAPLDKRGVMVFFEHLGFSLSESELGIFSHELANSNPQPLSFANLHEVFGTAWSLFKGKTTFPALHTTQLPLPSPRGTKDTTNPYRSRAHNEGTEEVGESFVSKKKRKKTRKKSGAAMEQVLLPSTSSDSYRAYHYFSSMYVGMVGGLEDVEMSPALFDASFRDSFSSKMLLTRVIPTIMQNTNSKNSITLDSFCEFFASPKQLYNILEESCSLQEKIEAYTKEFANYQSYTAVDKFKARLYVAELTKQMEKMDLALHNLADLYYPPSSSNPIDDAIIRLRKRRKEDGEMISKLSAPRSILPTPSSDLPTSILDGDHLSSTSLVVTRCVTLVTADAFANFARIVSSFVAMTSISPGCISSSFTSSKVDDSYCISQVWATSDSFKQHLSQEDFKNYQDMISSSPDCSETLSVCQVSSAT